MIGSGQVIPMRGPLGYRPGTSSKGYDKGVLNRHRLGAPNKRAL